MSSYPKEKKPNCQHLSYIFILTWLRICIGDEYCKFVCDRKCNGCSLFRKVISVTHEPNYYRREGHVK